MKNPIIGENSFPSLQEAKKKMKINNNTSNNQKYFFEINITDSRN
jgi:hypothetical protein